MKRNVLSHAIVCGFVLGAGALFACPVPDPSVSPTVLAFVSGCSTTVKYDQGDINLNTDTSDFSDYTAVGIDTFSVSVAPSSGGSVAYSGSPGSKVYALSGIITWSQPGKYDVTVTTTARWKKHDVEYIKSNTKTITVTVEKVAIATKPAKLCTRLASKKVSLTDDSFTGSGGTKWDGGGLTSTKEDAKTYTFSPKAFKKGEYAIVASANDLPTCNDSVKMLITAWDWYDTQKATVTFSPNITKDDIMKNGGVQDTLDAIKAAADQINASLNAFAKNNASTVNANYLIAQKKGYLGSLDEWINQEINDAVQVAVDKITKEIEKKKKNMEKNANNFCSDLANQINKKTAVPVNAHADYKYSSDCFDPGSPGWGELAITPPTLKEIHASFDINVKIEIDIKPFGLGTKIPVEFAATVSGKATLLAPYEKPSPLKVTTSPTASTKFAIGAEVGVDLGISTQTYIGCAIKGGGTFNFAFPEQDVTLTAKDTCPMEQTWVP